MLDLYCERMTPGFWAEPLNAITNIGFVLAAWFSWRCAVRTGQRNAVGASISGMIVAIGLGSFLFHTLATPLARWLDLLPIFAFKLCFIWLYLRRVIVLSTVSCCLLVLLFLLLLVGSMQYPGLFNGSFVYLPTLLVLVLLGSYHYQCDQAGCSLLLIAAALFCLSLWLRTIDAEACVQFQLGTHFLWHLLNALVIYLAARALLANLPATATHRC